MFAIQNRRTGKFLFGTDYRYNPPRQRTSFDEMRTYPDLSYAVADYNNRRCGEDRRIVVLKYAWISAAEAICGIKVEDYIDMLMAETKAAIKDVKEKTSKEMEA